MRLKWLMLDLNSYFASVEQHLNPELRGRPTIVVPLMSNHTCAIAASYEAKAFGIRTGTNVGEAKRLCPCLAIVPARHDVYVEFHHRIVEEVERHLHVTKVMSIDEMACELMGPERERENAVELARAVKAGIRTNVGDCLTCSVGIAPSRLLAKIASDLQKPDGLTVIEAGDLPGPLLSLALTDLPGIGANMERRLRRAGVLSVGDLYSLSPSRARAIWHSIEGERFWYGLHGIDPPEMETARRSVGHSNVLSPHFRAPDAAKLVARRLTAKAATRLRRMDYRARALSLAMRLEDGDWLGLEARFGATCDTFFLLRTLEGLWTRLARELRGRRLKKVGVTLHGLIENAAQPPDLFGWTPELAENRRSLKLSSALDALNRRYGRDAVTIGPALTRLPQYTGAKIAFNRIPDRAEFVE